MGIPLATLDSWLICDVRISQAGGVVRQRFPVFLESDEAIRGSWSRFGGLIILWSEPVGIEDNCETVASIPKSFSLAQNYPNPFNPSTTIEFDIPGESYGSQPVNLAVYDIRGRLVKMLIDSDVSSGNHTIHWDG